MPFRWPCTASALSSSPAYNKTRRPSTPTHVAHDKPADVVQFVDEDSVAFGVSLQEDIRAVRVVVATTGDDDRHILVRRPLMREQEPSQPITDFLLEADRSELGRLNPPGKTTQIVVLSQDKQGLNILWIDVSDDRLLPNPSAYNLGAKKGEENCCG